MDTPKFYETGLNPFNQDNQNTCKEFSNTIVTNSTLTILDIMLNGVVPDELAENNTEFEILDIPAFNVISDII